MSHARLCPFLAASFLLSAGLSAAQEPAAPALMVFQGLDELTARIPRLADRPYAQLWDTNGLYQTERVIFRDLETSNEVWSLSQELCTDIANIERRSAWSCDGRFISFIGNKVFWNHIEHKLWQRTWAGHHYVALADGSGRRALWGRYDGKLRLHDAKFNNWDQQHGNLLYFTEGNQLWRVTLGAAERDNVSEPIYTFPPLPQGALLMIQDVGDENILLIEESGGYALPGKPRELSQKEPRPCYVVDLRVAPTNPAFCSSAMLKGEGHPGSYRVLRGLPVRISGGYEDKSAGGGFLLELDPAHGLVPCTKPATAEDYQVRMYHLAYGLPDNRVAFSGEALGQHFGLWVQHPGQRPIRMASVNDGHPTWCGHDPDWFFYASGTGSSGPDPRYDRRLLAGRADGQEIRVLCTPFDRRRGAKEGGYDAIPRPNQSPDATKCWFHSSMLMPDNKYTGSFLAVFRRPYAPTALRYADGRLAWTPHMLSREVEGYLLYRREKDGWRLIAGPLSSTSAEMHEPGTYMLTALEWSDLESDTSSPTLEIPGGATGAPVRGFDRTPPPAVTGFAATTESDGRVRLRWDRSAASDTRYYNLYFSATNRPAIAQARLILSPPATVTSILDWTVPRGVAGHYAIVAVDRQDNVSPPAYVEGKNSGVRRQESE